jgi:hypothetical protein
LTARGGAANLAAVRRGWILGVAVLVVGLVARDAGAGRRRFAWLADTEVMPERTAELEWWVWERTEDGPRFVYLAVAGVIGLSDHLELSLPLELGVRGDGPGNLAGYGIELRARLASPDPARTGPLVPLVRAAARRLVQTDEARLDLGVVLSLDAGALRVVVDAGGYALTGRERYALAGGAGLSWRVAGELAAGVEAYAELPLDESDDEAWITAGPSLAFTHGRFWVAASLPIGLHGAAPDLLPRIQWAIAF